MLQHITSENLALMFQEAPTGDSVVWIGRTLAVNDDLELIPFVFAGLRFVMFFQSLENDADTEFAEMMLANWADGFRPHDHHRLIKFIRADIGMMKEAMFSPSEWKLPKQSLIFQFGDVLHDVILAHSEDCGTQQYFFKPETDALRKFYTRISGKFLSASHAFEPIPVEEFSGCGGFYGFQRKKITNNATQVSGCIATS